MMDIEQLGSTESFNNAIENSEAYQRLNERFLQARKVRRTPSSSTDVVAGDRLGDMQWDDSHLYILIEDSSNNIRWRRVALSSF